MTDWVAILGYIAAPISSVITWFVGRRKSRNDFLKDMQSSIDLLAERNKQLIVEVATLRMENASLQSDVQRLVSENAKMAKEIEELNARLDKVKTITKKA